MSRSQRKNSTIDPCIVCNSTVKSDDDGIQCDYCKNWIHVKCAKFTKAVYEALQLPGVRYYCVNCVNSVDRILELEKRLNDLEERFEKRITQLEEKLLTRLEPSQTNFEHITPNSSKNLVSIVKSTIEAETKRRNAVLFGLEEQDDDLSAVRDLISNGNPHEQNLKVKPSEITCVFRDGPKIPGKPRFLKVICVTSKVQHSFIELINKIVQQRNKNLRARPDLTWEQREVGRKLRKALENFDDTTNFYIDYNKQIIVNKTDRQIVFRLADDADST